MAGDEELKARASLTEMQLRIAEGPHAALGIAARASAEEIRAAFLQLTKQFHPARFGRMSTDVHKLSNEVFLGIKAAHDQMQKAATGAGTSRNSQSGAIPAMNADGTLRGHDLARRTEKLPPPPARGTSPPADQPQPLARGTQRPSTPNTTTGPIPRPVTPQPRPVTPQPATRASTPVVARTLTPQDTTRPGVPAPTRPTGPIRAITPPTDRPTTPTTAAIRAITPATDRPTPTTVTRPTTPRPSTPSSGPPNAPPRPVDYNPGTIRYSGAATPTARPSTPVFDERYALRECLMMLNERRWADARQALHTLAAKVPQSKNYRALLCYARGREAQTAGKPDEAQLEFQRALQLDPDLDLAKQAIAELARRR